MYFNFNKKDKRIENNFADLKPVFRKNYVVVGSDEKGKSYTTTVSNATLLEAKNDAKVWAKANSLKVDVVKAVS
jgi:hypothetical protein